MFIDTSIPSPAALAYLLRHPELDPEGFTFDYGDCNACGMGRANRQWMSEPFSKGPMIAAEETAELLGISKEDSARIFCSRSYFLNGTSREAIAEDLDALAAV